MRDQAKEGSEGNGVIRVCKAPRPQFLPHLEGGDGNDRSPGALLFWEPGRSGETGPWSRTDGTGKTGSEFLTQPETAAEFVTQSYCGCFER